ncbi:MAG TPA: carboxypeptidase-like regulatory domain-containing protein, partial [Ferruginibacter sp.]|nr:carboxypeptidase-like regulatory domain-containing protein [Ferruginibacter sp.]
PGGAVSSSYAAGIKGNGGFSGGPGSVLIEIKANGSAKSASNKQNQLVYSDDTNSTLENADIAVNPLYQSTGNTHENPLFKGNSKSISSGVGDIDSDGIPELMVSLIDPVNGAVLASTKTEANGDFFFANLPTGAYAVKVEGVVTQKKGYEVSIKKKLDIAGQIVNCDESWAVEIKHAKGTVEQAAAYVQKTRTKSNNSNDRLMSTANDNRGLVWSPRSNFKVLPMAIGDVDRDGLEEMMIGRGASLLGGALGGNFASRPGGPIKGIIVK